MKNLIATLLLVTFASVSASSHEDHGSPQNVQAPKGGVIKGLEETYIEVVVKGKDVKIYFYDKELKPRDVAGYKVSAQAELPRSKKIEPVKLTAKGGYFEAAYDAKGSHRYTLKLIVNDPKTGHNDNLQFTIEPKK